MTIHTTWHLCRGGYCPRETCETLSDGIQYATYRMSPIMCTNDPRHLLVTACAPGSRLRPADFFVVLKISKLRPSLSQMSKKGHSMRHGMNRLYSPRVAVPGTRTAHARVAAFHPAGDELAPLLLR